MTEHKEILIGTLPPGTTVTHALLQEMLNLQAPPWRCETCRHWSRMVGVEATGDDGLCSNDRIKAEFGDDYHILKADFGCNQWSPKE